MDFDYLMADKTFHVSINKKDNNYEVYLENELILIRPINKFSNFISIINNEKCQNIYFAKDKEMHYIFIDGQQYRIEDLNQAEQKSVIKDQLLLEEASEICAPMPGKILKILVKEGEEIEAKQNLVIVEAMKMENNINSPVKGKVKKINFHAGDIVDTGQPIIELEALE